MSETKPVLIVGAGPTGLTAAMELSRLGVPVRIVDKLAEPSTTSRALAVQARTLELLVPRGPGEEMIRLGNPARATTIYADGKRLAVVDLTRIPSRFNYALMLSQAETERLLRTQLTRQGVQVERPVELLAFSQQDEDGRGGVSATLRHGDGALEELEAAYLVCAEGAHSNVRHTLDLAFEGKSLATGYALADLHIDGDLPSDELTIFTRQHGFAAVFPMGPGHFRFIATEPGDRDGAESYQHKGEPSLEELQKLYDEDAHIPARLRDIVWASRFRVNSRMLRTLRTGRIFFGGDSAHIHSPAGGQGMNTGIQDMINLGWKLSLVWHGQAAPDLLDTYQQDRLPVIRGVVRTTETATDALNSESALVHGLITHALPVLLSTRFAQENGTAVLSETANHYRASTLSDTRHAPGKLHAGDRVPDPDVCVTGGQPDPLYRLLDPSRLVLLVAGGGDTAGLERELAPWREILKIQHLVLAADVKEATESFEQLFGTGGGLLLVRPDAYLGFAGRRGDLPALVQWLERWFPAKDAATP